MNNKWDTKMKTTLITDFGEQTAREPVIRRMKNGTIICLFLTGGPSEPHNSNIVACSKSYDNGKTWTNPETLFSHKSRGVWATEIFTETEIPFIVLHTYNAENHYRELQTFRSFSYDNGETWTEPESFPGGINGVSVRQGIRLSNGEILFPLYWQKVRYNFDWNNSDEGHGDEEKWPFSCGVAISSDEGNAWIRCGDICDKKSLWEPNCIEAEPGHILMYMRDNANPYLRLCESFDYGRTWGQPVVTDIPNPNTKVTLVKIGETFVMVNNFKAEIYSRTNLEIRISKDYGKTWTNNFCLVNGGERYFYPHAFADIQNRNLYVSYENAHQHYFAEVSFDELGI